MNYRDIYKDVINTLMRTKIKGKKEIIYNYKMKNKRYFESIY